MKADVAPKPPCCDPELSSSQKAELTGQKEDDRLKADLAPKHPCCDPEPSSSHKAALTGQKKDE